MAIKLSGMASGLDTDSIVKELMSAQSMKKTKIENKQKKLNWSQEIWKDLNTKLLALQRGTLTKVKTQGNYNTKKVGSSDATKATATAANSAAKGAHSLEISQLASAQYLTGGVITKADGGTVSSTTKLEDLGIAENTVITIQAAKTSSTTNGSNVQKVTVGATTTISDFVSACQSAGLNATFDATQKRLFISSANSGTDQKFSITTSSASTDLPANLTSLKELTGYNDSTTTTIQKAELDSCYNVISTAANTSTEYQDAYNKIVTYAANNSTADYKTKFDAAKTAYKDTLTTDVEATMAAITAGVDTAGDYNVVDGTAADIVTAIETIKQNAGIESTISAQVAKDKTSLDSTISSYIANSKALATGNNMLSKIGMAEITGDTAITSGTTSGVSGLTLVTAKNSKFTLDGASMEESTNNFTVNYITFDLKGTTDVGSPLKISVDNDATSTYDMVKSFVKEYNTILKKMNDMYSATAAKGYEPLTDDQKEAMTDDEVEKWETKIKDSLLRRDDTLGSLTTAMKNALMGQISIGGKSYSLASFGIHTSSDYTEKGLLHIYGDSEDDTYSSKDNDLKAMLESDPDLVMKGLSEITKNLYNTMNEKTARNSLKSAMKFYNDKEMDNQNKVYKKQISEWEDKLDDLESKYYKQFSQMETAMSKLNSQSNSLSSLLGKG